MTKVISTIIGTILVLGVIILQITSEMSVKNKVVADYSNSNHTINIYEKGFTIEIEYIDVNNKIETYSTQNRYPSNEYEVIDGCLFYTNGINQSLVCYVKYIKEIKYIANIDNKRYYF